MMKTVAPLLLVLLLAAPVQAAPPSSGTAVSTAESRPGPPDQDDAGAGKKEREPPPFGFGGWGHFGGGAGAMIGARKVSPVGRVDIGFGGYLFLLYGGFAANVTFSQHMDLVITGVAYGGLAIPIPLFRPLIGFKFGGGLHQDFDYGPSPAIQLGPQIGVHIGQIAGSKFGIRVMVDAEALVSTKHRIAGFSVIGTVALML